VVTVQGTVSFYAAVDYLQVQKPFTTFCGRPQRAPLFGSAGGSGPVSNDAEFISAQPIATGGCKALKLPVQYPNFQVNDGFGWGHPPLLSRTPLRRGVGGVAGADRRALERQGTIPKLARARPLKISQAPIAHVARDSDFPTAVNAQLPAGALTAKQFARYAAVSAAATAQRTILTRQRLRAAAIARLSGVGLPSITSTAMQFGGAARAKAAFTALGSLDAGTNAPAGDTAKVAPAAGSAGDVITYSGTAPGVEVIAQAGSSVYALRELQTTTGPVSAKAASTLLAALIKR
jgi:hypothetical protein